MPRGLLPLDEGKIAAMAFAGASNRDIAEILEVDEGTIRKRFSAVVAKQRALRRLSLRQLQWKAAQKGNPALLIFLGKQELGQEDLIRLAPEDLQKMTDGQLEAIVNQGRGARGGHLKAI